MIVTEGKFLKVEVDDFEFETTALAPGKIVMRGTGKVWEGQIELPASPAIAARICEAYLHCANIDVGYRKRESK